MKDIENLKEELNVLDLLCIQNEDTFTAEVSELFKKSFRNIYIASNAQESADLFKKNNPQIVIIDVDIADFNWLESATHIKDVNPETKIIVLSKNNTQKNLLDAINTGVIKFLIKPTELPELTQSIKLAITQINYENNAKIFHTYLNSTFSYQDAMVLMIKDNIPILANRRFLDFFDVESINEFTNKHSDLGTLFLEHDDFLYNKADKKWLDDVSEDFDKLYHVKLKNKDKEVRHFFFKCYLVPKESSFIILSFSDITELDLVEVDKVEKSQEKPIIEDIKGTFTLFELIQKNKIKVHVYNYYKGLTIVHDALIVDVKENSLVIKTDYLQQKAIQVEEKILISSEILPCAIRCNKISNISFEKQTVKLQDIHLSHTSPASRKTIRLLPDSKYNVSLFINKQKHLAQIEICDISIDSINLKFDYAPTNLKINDKVFLDMVLNYQNKPLRIYTEATVIKLAKEKHNSTGVFAFNLDLDKKNTMLKYIATRQIEIIKEFKNIKEKIV